MTDYPVEPNILDESLMPEIDIPIDVHCDPTTSQESWYSFLFTRKTLIIIGVILIIMLIAYVAYTYWTIKYKKNNTKQEQYGSPGPPLKQVQQQIPQQMQQQIPQQVPSEVSGVPEIMHPIQSQKDIDELRLLRKARQNKKAGQEIQPLETIPEVLPEMHPVEIVQTDVLIISPKDDYIPPEELKPNEQIEEIESDAEPEPVDEPKEDNVLSDSGIENIESDEEPSGKKWTDNDTDEISSLIDAI